MMTSGDDLDLVSRARAYAEAVHAGDTRKGTGVSYFAGHLQPVAEIVDRDGGSDVQVAAAYLHDAAEDHGGQAQLAEIEDRFGSEVAAIVRDLSDSLLAEGEVKEAWRPRKERYIASLDHKDVASLEVAAADKLHNATSLLADFERIGHELWERFNEPDPEQQLWYYRSLANAIRERLGPHATAIALDEAVARLEAAVRGAGAGPVSSPST